MYFAGVILLLLLAPAASIIAGHVQRGGGNAKEQLALVSDLWAFALLAVFVGNRLL